MKDTILPDVVCPASRTVLLSGDTMRVALGGATATDNQGLKLLQYQPFIPDTSATFTVSTPTSTGAPKKLLLTPKRGLFVE